MNKFSKWLGPRTHTNYWANSDFAQRIRRTFGGFEQISCGTLEEWDAYREAHQHKFTYWLTDTAFDWLQDVVYLPYDIWDNVRYRTKNRFFYKLHVLPTRLTPGNYYEAGTRLMHGMFELLVDFVELEKAKRQAWSREGFKKSLWFRIFDFTTPRSRKLGEEYLKWEISLSEPNVDEWGNDMSSPIQAQVAKEISEIYTWWKDVRPNRPDPHDVSGWSEICEERGTRGMFSHNQTEEQQQKTSEALARLDTIEKQYADEDEQMMIRLVRIRQSLWV